MSAPDISVLVPSHNPDPTRLRRTIDGLLGQSLDESQWELVVIDNASASNRGVADAVGQGRVPVHTRVVLEPELGLTHARRRGLKESRAELCVFVDDDNVLEASYLQRVVDLFAAHPQLGAAGGKSRPEFESSPPPWVEEFLDLLACRDLGSTALLSGRVCDASGRQSYPSCAPIGAGMAVRRSALAGWLASSPSLPDRKGAMLSSSGDNDMVFAVLDAGWHVGYFPELALTHLIPVGRTSREYLGRINRGIQRSWMHVLARHNASVWSPISPWSLPLRQLRAWFNYHAWKSDAHYVRWQGACGHFEGRTDVC